MIYLIVSIIALLICQRKRLTNSITFCLFGLLSVSSICAFLTGRQHSLEFIDILYTIYIVVLLCILFCSFKKFGNIRQLKDNSISEQKLITLEKIITILGSIAFIISVYVLYHVMWLLLTHQTSVAEHKYQGESDYIFSTIVPRFFVTFVNIISPLGYFCMALHFWYLIKKDLKKSILFFVLSLLIVTSGMMGLSRSSTVQYILTYLLIFFIIIPMLSTRVIKRFLIIGCIGGFILLYGLSKITDDKSGDVYYKHSLNEDIINIDKHPKLYSIVDYIGQWGENAIYAMHKYDPDEKFYGLYNCNGLAVWILNKTDDGKKITNEIDKKLENRLGYESIVFHGLITRLVYDFGYIGAFVFIILLVYYIKKYSPSNHTLTLRNIVALVVLLPIAILFFAGNALSSVSLDLALLYNLIIMSFIKI